MILLKFGTFGEIEYFKERNIVSDIDRYPLLSPNNAFLSFFEEISSDTFDIDVYNVKGFLATRIKSTQIKHKIIIKDGKKYVMYCGDKINCLDLPCDLYFIKLGEKYSQVFFSNDLRDYDKIMVSSKYAFKDIPYSAGFIQTYYFHENFLPPVVKKYHKIEKNKKDEDTLLYSRYYFSFNNSLYEQTANIQEFFSHLDNCEITVYSGDKSYVVKSGNSNIEIERSEDKVGYFNINFEFSSTISEINNCDVDGFSLLRDVNVTDNSCPVVNPIQSIIVNCDEGTGLVDDIIFFITIEDA